LTLGFSRSFSYVTAIRATGRAPFRTAPSLTIVTPVVGATWEIPISNVVLRISNDSFNCALRFSIMLQWSLAHPRK
jgi:hypothetical protein